MLRRLPGRGVALSVLLAGGSFGALASAPRDDDPIVDAELEDFFIPGTQPESLIEALATADDCHLCHSGADTPSFPYDRWAHSIMAQASRDPIFYACLDIANHDVGNSGDLCIRCHVPIAWLNGRSSPTDGSAFLPQDVASAAGDRDGVSCTICHRMIDPVNQDAGPFYESDDTESDWDDLSLIAISVDPAEVPTAESRHSGSFVIDPLDYRRGPYELNHPHNGEHAWATSPFHRRADLCGTCHDVSNPAYALVNGTYTLVADAAPHPTGNKYEMFPIERTYSEWSASEFAQHPVEMNGKFDPKPGFTKVSTCQSCHMPRAADGSKACSIGDPVARNDIGIHNFNGVNSWVLKAIGLLDYDNDGNPDFPDSVTGLTEAGINASLARTQQILSEAATIETSSDGETLLVRVYNNAGHKLPSGYPEGRRMWLNVKFLDFRGKEMPGTELGAYDEEHAELAGARTREFDTKVYEAVLGVDEAVAQATGVNGGEAGHTFHFVLNNVYLKDNRIPPRGFNHAAFAAVQAAPIESEKDAYPSEYADGQYWDDTEFPIPDGAAFVEVCLLSQTTTKEYIEFLRDANPFAKSDPKGNRGTIAYDAWYAAGRSAPITMACVQRALSAEAPKRYFVDDGARGRNDGSSWENAFNDLTTALTIVIPGDEIWVAEGLYRPLTAQDLTFRIPSGVRVFGGFGGWESLLTERANRFAQTILTGELTPTLSSHHVVSFAGGAGMTRLDGFTITGGVAAGGSGTSGGAGVDLAGGGDFTLANCFVRGNLAEESGAGVRNGMSGILTIANCAFTGNAAGAVGGAILSATGAYTRIINCSTTGNSASAGAAIAVADESMAIVSNSILYGDLGRSGKSKELALDGSGAASVAHSCVEGWTGELGGIGNFDSPPCFVDANGADNVFGTADDDLRLRGMSLCIDVGKNVALPSALAVDLGGLARLLDDPEVPDGPGTSTPAIDLGAHEFDAAGFCEADFSGDGIVKGDDLREVLAAWGDNVISAADLNCDGDVNGADLAIFLAQWGPCGGG